MSLRYALLGLLADQPQSGYDLTQRFELSLKRYAWHAGHSQIYPELNKLAASDLITVVAEGARGRRTYALTDAGRQELREWLTDRPSAQPVRNEFVLRLFLLSTLDPPEALPILRAMLLHARQELTELRSRSGNIDVAPGEPMEFGRLAAEYGLRQYQAMIDWAEWALTKLGQDASEHRHPDTDEK
ncbi:PadR family transcriptional regulator [Saccharopolyspora sp. 5N708]|uniref:PadR family transcriptional regulator n=1 Tax=Saccharopolyspora sp. 5N708 TaxID=3457424 RepID=UPI003FCF808B